MNGQIRIPIRRENDIIIASQQGRLLADLLGFEGKDQAIIATVILELARCVIKRRARGEVRLSVLQNGGKKGILIFMKDEASAFAGVDLARQEGDASTSDLHLNFALHLLDEFEVQEEEERGTTIAARMWLEEVVLTPDASLSA